MRKPEYDIKRYPSWIHEYYLRYFLNGQTGMTFFGFELETTAF